MINGERRRVIHIRLQGWGGKEEEWDLQTISKN